ncbi:hypothetical protein ALI44B_12415 [Leifsonia sp. ALI-44-B]|uniref:HAD family hydrolase n=1 Tax=Leifsonia sp. ALI-44-B TaxID=1933776 RepID=UPI00097C6DC8|nr:HAD-IB family hydrolase [Leifsonia sp. ALI-44-B]ONI61259.1 hypothetical protein ALI44B_12415 [Leifsonia sp. ALI-44-B]
MATDQAAYFDVDHTITRTGTLRSFLDFYAADPRGRFVAQRVAGLERAVAATHDRVTLHRLFVEAFAGETWSGLERAGADWFADFAVRDGFTPSVIERMRRHQDLGHRAVFVSGSWWPCLAPIAAHFGVTEVLCTMPVVVRDQVTGEMVRAMVSDTKATAVRDHAAQHSIDLARSIAYGDDESDLPLLRTTGRAVVVGGDPVLLGWAANRRGSVEVLDAQRIPVVSSEVGQ